MRTTAKHHTGILLHRSQFVQTLVTMLEGPAVRDRERERDSGQAETETETEREEEEEEEIF